MCLFRGNIHKTVAYSHRDKMESDSDKEILAGVCLLDEEIRLCTTHFRLIKIKAIAVHRLEGFLRVATLTKSQTLSHICPVSGIVMSL